MAKRVARMAMWTALAMVFSYVEAIIPFSFGVQGVKLGLANIVVLAGLYMMPAKDVFVILHLPLPVAKTFLPGVSSLSIIVTSIFGLFSFKNKAKKIPEKP